MPKKTKMIYYCRDHGIFPDTDKDLEKHLMDCSGVSGFEDGDDESINNAIYLGGLPYHIANKYRSKK